MRLVGAIDAVMIHELFAVLDEFFQDSNIWQEEVVVTTTADEQDYEIIIATASATVTRLMAAIHNDGKIKADMRNELGVLHLQDPWNAGSEITVCVALTVLEPTDADDLPVVPEWILTKYWRGILDGLLARMESQPSKPYTNTTLATYHGRSFKRTVSRARAEANSAHLYGGQRWQFPQNFATGRG